MTQIVHYEHEPWINLLYGVYFFAFLVVISQGHSTPQFRLLMSLSTAAVLYGYRIRRLESRNLAWMTATILLLYSYGHPDFQLTITIMCFTIFYALTVYIPPNYLGMTVFICMLGFYSVMTLHAMHVFLDNFAQGVTLALAVLVWNLCMGVRPAFHLE
jgi:hypothetical protein